MSLSKEIVPYQAYYGNNSDRQERITARCVHICSNRHRAIAMLALGQELVRWYIEWTDSIRRTCAYWRNYRENVTTKRLAGP